MNKETIELLNMSWKDAHKSNKISEWREAQNESFWYRYIHPLSGQKNFQMTMILPDTGDFCIDEIYHDQAPLKGCISSCYTPESLREKEGWIIRQIIDDNRKYSLENLKIMVMNNPHYHDTIKDNLIHNIENRKLNEHN